MNRSIRQRWSDAIRAWKAGPGVVEKYEKGVGHDSSTYNPSAYGDYLVTSNGVYTCAKIRAEACANVAFKASRFDAQGKKIPDRDSDVVRLLQKVNKFWTMNRLLNMTELSLCTWGMNYWAVEKDSKGNPVELWWMKTDRVVIKPDPVNYVSGYAYCPINGEKPIIFDVDEVVWFRYPNPLDEYSGLSPMAAARLAADVASAAGKSNLGIFKNGYQVGGLIMPKAGLDMTSDQATELEEQFDARFRGEDKAHKWGVLRLEVETKQLGITPKDAEFLGALEWSLEEIARAYGIPLDMVGGQRTYENVKASDRAFWMRTMMPELNFIASEINEQLLPMFKTRPDLVEFDLAKVPALLDDESDMWTREQGQITVGAITINEWRAMKGLDPVKWGDAWWAPMANAPVKDGKAAPPAESPAEKEIPTESEETPEGERGKGRQRGVEYDSDEHRQAMATFERRMSKWEEPIRKKVEELFKRQRNSLIDKMKASGEITRARISADDLFSMSKWVKLFRQAIRPVLREVVGDAGDSALEDLGLNLAFNVSRPEVLRFLEKRAQRFAVEVNETTWEALKDSLVEGLEAGEKLEKLMERVTEEMNGRIESSAETIARTEALGAANGGSLEAWRQSGANPKKAWLSALQPGRTRDSHVAAHNRYQAEPIGLDEDFEVGNGRGPHPGAIGLPEEDINCLCTMVPVVD